MASCPGLSMSLHTLSFRFLFSSSATVLHLRRRELKLLSSPSFLPSTSSAPISSLPQGHLRLVPSAGPTEQEVLPADSHSATPNGTSSNASRNKGRRRSRRKRKDTATEKECVPSAEEVSIRIAEAYESGDPLGRKELGRCVMQWLKMGMYSMASTFASTEVQNDGAAFSLDGGSSEGNLEFMILAQPYLAATPMPKGHEALCLKASTHYPTLFDHFQRELREVLLKHQNEGLISDWRSTESWMLLKKLAKSSQHRQGARKPKAPVVHNLLGISLDKTRLMQTKIEDFVKKMSDLLHIERDAELEFTQEELNATPTTDSAAKQPLKPVEYLVSHGQAEQEQCDTVCNLNVISTSTGLGGLRLVLFRVEGTQKLPPSTLSPGDMVCVRTCNQQGEVGTSCVQGFVHNLGEDGCSITVSLKSRPGDPTFSKFSGKSVRIDRIQALADGLTYEETWITRCALLLLDTRMPYGSLNIDCEEHLDLAGTGSFYNSGEADIVAQHVVNLVLCGVSPTSIVVQSPYIAQVQLLRHRLEEYPEASGVEVSTIDSFQGREADAVVISMVRSNSLGAVGFLGDNRRMNVAITRARRHVALVCDSSTICNNDFLSRLLRHIRQHGQVRHVEPGSYGGDYGLGFSPPALPSIS